MDTITFTPEIIMLYRKSKHVYRLTLCFGYRGKSQLFPEMRC